MQFPVLLIPVLSVLIFCHFLSAEETVSWNQDNKVFKAVSEHEGGTGPFMRAGEVKMTTLFAKGRFPNVVAAMDGSILAVFGGVELRRSTDAGESWGEPVQIAKGFMGGGVTVDEISGEVLAFVEEGHPPSPLGVHVSQDHGISWELRPSVIHPNSLGHVPSMHMNEHGICLRRGPYKGRLLRAVRWYGRRNYPRDFFHTHYTNAMFSDDGGRSWKASEPVPVMGSGEAALVELSDGSLYYNTRRHWAQGKQDSLWRWTVRSTDGGATWVEPVRSEVLPDGNTDSSYGLMGGLVRLPVLERDILLYSNIVSDQGRRNGHIWASFDGGKSWPMRRQIHPGAFGYSSMCVGRKGTASEGWVFLFFEGGKQAAGTMARFNLSWILGGDRTGDGELPEWMRQHVARPVDDSRTLLPQGE